MSKIESTGPQGAPPVARSRPSDAAPAGATSGKPAPAVVPSDSVRLTGDALRLQQVSRAAASAPDIDLKRVSETREKLRDGSYQVRPQTIAAKLSRLEWELSS
ncbi:MAG TPA: flagellar biosynthesis anti-sigma factor FlgM [Solimonas sp.]|nr:flagellar biosynthesis anti-sigma factor FlgM [Solimonas sp.]